MTPQDLIGQHMSATAIAIVLAMFAATGAQWALLRAQVPLFSIVPDWVYRPVDTPMCHGWVFGLVCAFGLVAAAAVLRHPRRRSVNFCWVLAFGCAVHFGLVVLRNRGLDSEASYREAGHGEYVTLASAAGSMLDTVRHYEVRLASGDLGHHPHSKPPGHLLFYMLTDRCANVFSPSTCAEARVKRTTTAIMLVWPVVALLCVVPLYCFGSLVAGRSEAMIACVLFACVPSLVTLNTLCLDTVLYPSLFMWSIVAAVESCRRGSPWLALAAGALMFVCTFVSFSLLALYAVGPLLVFCLCSPCVTGGGKWQRVGRTLIGMGAGLLAAYALFRLLLGYDAFARFSHAMAFHRQGMARGPGFVRSWYFSSLNFSEFWFYLGAPIVVLFIASLARACRGVLTRRADALDRVCLCVLVTQLMLAAFGGAKHETSRYWTFLVPLLCLLAAREIARLWRAGPRWGVWSVMVLQLVTALMIARY